MKWMALDSIWYHDVLVAFACLIIAVVPAIPYGVIAAIIGAKYGFAAGAALNLIISVTASIVLFLLVRLFFSEEGRVKTANRKGFRMLTQYAEHNAFFTVFFARTLPIVPAQVVNVLAAVTRMPLQPFIWGTIIGKIPYLATVTLVGDQVMKNADITQLIILAAGYLLFVCLVYGIYRLYFQKGRRQENR